MREIKESERLDKVLANNGFGTRKDVRRIVRSGSVTVNGQVVSNPEVHVNVHSDSIAVDGNMVAVRTHVYFMLNKPDGYVCSTKDGLHPTVFDLFSPDVSRTYSGGDLGMVGRLDLDTEGLLIVTSDGSLNHRLTSPKNKVPKKYLVHLRYFVPEEERRRYETILAQGIYIEPEGNEEGAVCQEAFIEWPDVSPESGDVCCLTVFEGKYHEVKRIFLALKNEVTYLKRLSINTLSLDPNLKPGEYRELTEEELSKLDPDVIKQGRN